MVSKTLLKIDSLYAGYGGIDVLRDISLELNVGEFVSVVGPNGAGKSTLFKTISGIVQPNRGTIALRGESLEQVAPAKRAHLGIAHVPEGRQVFTSLTVLENLEMGAVANSNPVKQGDNLDRIHQWFPILKERSGQLAGTLSGGEQQMLAIGRGLMAEPEILMLDEPSMGLAPAIVDEIFERLIDIHHGGDMGILLVEQRVTEALHFANQAYVLEAGNIILSGAPSELQDNDRIRQVYLGM